MEDKMAEQMDNRPIAIKVSGVKKMYKLGQIGGGTLRADLQSWWAKKRGKEDPNTKIGEERLIGQTFMALNGIDLTIYQGEAVGIIGSNGAGKSTLLKLLCQVTAPTEGRIDLYGRIASMLEVGTGFNPEMTGRENIYMNGAILGMTKQEIDAKMEEIIEFSEVRDFIDTPVKRYSSGMFVKLAFSVAAHLDSEIMIMDEVLAVGDMAFQTKCLDKMREASNQDNKTVLYVSHNMNTIKKLCDRVIVLEKGKAIFEGNVDTGVDFYLGNKFENNCHIDLGEKKREKWGPATKVKMTRFDVWDRERAIYNVGEMVKGTLSYIGYDNIEDVFLRITIKDSENTPVTMTQTSKTIKINKDIEYKNELIIDTSSLVPGKYYFSFTLFYTNGFGSYECVDWLSRIFSFEIISIPSFNHGLEWKKNVWGSIYLDDITLGELRRI